MLARADHLGYVGGDVGDDHGRARFGQRPSGRLAYAWAASVTVAT